MNTRSYPGQTTTIVGTLQQTAKRTLLIVDDDEGVRRSLQVVFDGLYDIMTASSGAEALNIVRTHSIDAAILDIRMAGMNGIELLERIKSADSSIEALMLTGYESMDTLRQALRLGACDYLTKPFDIEAIRAAVSAAMDRRSLSEEIRATQRKMAFLQAELQQQSLREEITRNKGEIYASVLHDINGPLTVISGYIDLMNAELEDVNRLESNGVEMIKDHVRVINRQLTHCVEISRRYLSFLREKPQGIAAVKVNSVLSDVKALLRNHPSRQDRELVIETVSGNPDVLINGADLIQVLVNLTVNAFQSASDSVPVTISGGFVGDEFQLPKSDSVTERVLFAPGFNRQQRMLRLSVCDSGVGMSPEVLKNIFKPFFTTKGDKGTGLGLSIVQRLINDANGAIYVRSEQGKGTTFEILLPLAKL